MPRRINQEFYDRLGTRWFEDEKHPIALLRAETRFRNPWIIDRLAKEFPGPCNVVDVGCGGGLTSAPLSELGYKVVGLDLSVGSLSAARTKSGPFGPLYGRMDAREIAIRDAWADAVLCTDLLEHVEDPGAVVQECSRILRPGGLFVFYTFNRTVWSWIFAKKAIDWIFKDGPKDIHLSHMFIRPSEMQEYCRGAGLRVESMEGIAPQLDARALYTLLIERRVPDDLRFRSTKSLRIAYMGVAKKEEN